MLKELGPEKCMTNQIKLIVNKSRRFKAFSTPNTVTITKNQIALIWARELNLGKAPPMANI